MSKEIVPMGSWSKKNNELLFFRRWGWLAQGLWGVLLIAALTLHQQQTRHEIMALAQQSAQLSSAYIDSLRRWNLHAGGVYIAVAQPGRSQATTSQGQPLQRLVPAQMLSHIQNNYPTTGVRSRLTSLAPLNPANTADTWEHLQLQHLSGIETTSEQLLWQGEAVYRALYPLPTDPQCHACHPQADDRQRASWGALSIIVPLAPFQQMLQLKSLITRLSLVMLWLVGSIGIATTTRSLRKRIRLRDRAQQGLQRSNNLYAALSATNQAIAQQLPQQQLFERVCELAVQYGGFKLAWVGLVDEQNQRLTPVARAGTMGDYIDEIRVSIDPQCAEGQGPTSRAIRENQPVIVDNFLQQLAATPWFEAAMRNGIRSSAAFPISRGDKVIGALKVYADQTDYFTSELCQLLQQMAADLSLAIGHQQQQRQLEHSQAMNQTLIDALPYPALLARYSDQRVVTANRKALEMGIVVGEVSHCCQPPSENGDGNLHVKERQHADGRWDMICWCPVEGSDDDDIYLHFAIDITDRKKQESQIEDMAHRDPLTGLANRRYFNLQLQREISSPEVLPFNLLLLDLNRFKQINDTHGHLVGDQLLQHVSRRLRGALREGDTLCRWGGDEFVIMLPDSSPAQAGDLAQRIVSTFFEPFQLEGLTLTVGCSIGVASYPQDGTEGEALLQAADRAMYQHKQGD